jgi:hypothetical protein
MGLLLMLRRLTYGVFICRLHEPGDYSRQPSSINVDLADATTLQEIVVTGYSGEKGDIIGAAASSI